MTQSPSKLSAHNVIVGSAMLYAVNHGEGKDQGIAWAIPGNRRTTDRLVATRCCQIIASKPVVPIRTSTLRETLTTLRSQTWAGMQGFYLNGVWQAQQARLIATVEAQLRARGCEV